ncbi:MAG: glycosyltransferase family 4 protein [Inquilinaceae bacterium]
MKVAFYAPMKPPGHAVPSGDRRMARLFMAALRRGGHRVTLASRLRAWDDGTDPGRPARIRRRAEAVAHRLIDRWRTGAGRPDAWFTYHLYHKAPDWIGPPVCGALDLPYIAAEASYAGKRATGPWAEGLAATVAALGRADAVVALSAVDEVGLRRVVPDPGRIVRMAPFLDPAPFVRAAARRGSARRRLWRDDPGPWLLAVGMMRDGDKARSYAVLAESLDRLGDRLGDRPWRLAVAGDGPARDAVLARFRPERLKWLGTLDLPALADAYAAADLLVWPAINEAFGMALLEAQASGLPVVAGDSGGVPEIVRHERTGLVTPAGDAAAFAAAIGRLLDRPDERRAMGEAASRHVHTDHGLDRAAGLLDAVLKRVRR